MGAAPIGARQHSAAQIRIQMPNPFGSSRRINTTNIEDMFVSVCFLQLAKVYLQAICAAFLCD